MVHIGQRAIMHLANQCIFTVSPPLVYNFSNSLVYYLAEYYSEWLPTLFSFSSSYDLFAFIPG